MSTGVSPGRRNETAVTIEARDLGEVVDNLGVLLYGVALVQVTAGVAMAAVAADVGFWPVDVVLTTAVVVAGLGLGVGLPASVVTLGVLSDPERTERALLGGGRCLAALYGLTVVAVGGAAAFGVELGLPVLVAPPVGGLAMAAAYATPLCGAVGMYCLGRSVSPRAA